MFARSKILGVNGGRLQIQPSSHNYQLAAKAHKVEASLMPDISSGNAINKSVNAFWQSNYQYMMTGIIPATPDLTDSQSLALFYRDMYSGNGFYPQPLNTAFNGFAKEAYKKDPRFNEQLVLAINNGYTAQFEELNDIHIYFNLKNKDKKIIDNLIESMRNYYASILNFYNVCKKDRNNLDASVDCLENSYTIFFNRIQEVDNARILDKMDKSLQVK